MKQIIRQSIFIFCICLPIITYAQTDSIKNQIASHFTNYFSLEREAIYVHFDKKTFLSDENIWFKGYVLNRKTKTPFLLTTNVFAVLTDQQGNKIDDWLLFSNNGSFSGNIKLKQGYLSGNYYLRFYTNWMKNFTEDESAVYKITIINSKKPGLPSNKPDYSKINIDIIPEGGNLVYGIKNVVGLKLSDCFGNPLSVKEAEIIDEQGHNIRTVTLNRFGYGKFDLIPSVQHYKTRLTINGTITEVSLPPIQQDGIALEVNNYALPGKTIILLNINQGYFTRLKNKKFFITLNQDDQITIFETDFSGGTQQKLVFSNDNLLDGVNTIRIIDSEMNELASRQLFKYPAEQTKIDIIPIDNSDKFTITTNCPNANMSISVLPEHSISDNPHDDFRSCVLLNTYVSEQVSDVGYYFDNVSKIKSYEMDLMLLNQKSMKYNWQNIRQKVSKVSHDFDYGLTIKGSIIQSLPKPENCKVRIISAASGIDEYTDIKNGNEFNFKFLVIADSSDVSIGVYKAGDVVNPLPVKLTAAVTNAKRTFHIPHKSFSSADCKLSMDSVYIDLPFFSEKDIIKLKQVEIDNRNKLTRQMAYGNAMLKGYKITAENNGLDVINFIGNHGFDVQKTKGTVNIYGRSRTTINGQRNSPVVYIDNIRIMDYDQLWGMSMDEIDEIYLNAQAIVPSVTNNIGVIRIYRKKISQYPNKQPKNNMYTFKIDGYEKIQPFVNADYSGKSDAGFENFGVIHWIPNILADENGSFTFQLPSTGKRNVKLLIEGITPEGRLISEIKTISVK